MMKKSHIAALIACSLLGCNRLAEAPPPEDETVGAAEQAIVGGEIDEGHPYVVALGDEYGIWCTGTVISRRTVITAAHCFELPITRVYFGTHLQDHQPAEVADSAVHPGWNFSMVEHDVALLKLAQPAPVQPAPLLRQTMDNSDEYIGPDFTFCGYGLDDAASYSGAGVRRVVQMPITTVGETTTADGLPVRDFEIYYEHPSKNTCFGDSGGPTFYVSGGVEHHAALTSWGDEYCAIYGVQARTDAPVIEEFIQPTIDAFEADDPCRADGVCAPECDEGATVIDPDCAAQHCGQDGVCAAACVDGDVDCPEPTSETGQESEPFGETFSEEGFETEQSPRPVLIPGWFNPPAEQSAGAPDAELGGCSISASRAASPALPVFGLVLLSLLLRSARRRRGT